MFYHYTSREGLVGILSSGQINATTADTTNVATDMKMGPGVYFTDVPPTNDLSSTSAKLYGLPFATHELFAVIGVATWSTKLEKHSTRRFTYWKQEVTMSRTKLRSRCTLVTGIPAMLRISAPSTVSLLRGNRTANHSRALYMCASEATTSLNFTIVNRDSQIR